MVDPEAEDGVVGHQAMLADSIGEGAEGEAFGVDVQDEDAELVGLDLGGKGAESVDEELVFPFPDCLGCLGCPLATGFHVSPIFFPPLAALVRYLER